jgi:ribonuclease J
VSNAQVKFDKKSVYFVPLGGCGHFGANLNLYHYDGQWLALDCGMGFADERYPGVDILLPDPSFIEKQQDKLAGLIITHAHEDHIGGVVQLWPRLKCPVYATPFTMEALKRKLSEAPYGHEVPLVEIPNMGRADIGPFKTEWVNMAHSIPDTSSIVVKAGDVTIFHSGDWHFDPNPTVGHVCDEARLSKLGQEGVHAYVGDSTNAGVPGVSGSESDLHDDFLKLFRRAKGKIGVTLFSSNIGRLKTVLTAAAETKRYVCLVGRSLKNMADIAAQFNLLDLSHILTEDQAAHMSNNQLVYVMTGSQGESRAQLPKVAKGDHPTVSLGQGDMLVFSARAIPGNERAIIDMRNQLTVAGVEVITPRDHHIHISGHPAQDEVLKMFDLIKPNAVIPVHGEFSMQLAHQNLAKKNKVPFSILPENGTVIRITKEKIEQVGRVEASLLAFDEKRILPLDHPSIRERRKLSFNGTAFVTMLIGDALHDILDIQLSTLGLLDEESEEGAEVLDAVIDIIGQDISKLSHKEWQNDAMVEDKIRVSTRRYFRDWLGIKPVIIAHLVRVSD